MPKRPLIKTVGDLQEAFGTGEVQITEISEGGNVDAYSWLREYAKKHYGQALSKDLLPDLKKQVKRAHRLSEAGVVGLTLADFVRKLDPEGAGKAILGRCLAVLPPQQSRIFEYLFERKTARYDQIANIPGAFRVDDPSNEAIEKALKRIRTRLDENPSLRLTLVISSKKRRVRLESLRDK